MEFFSKLREALVSPPPPERYDNREEEPRLSDGPMWHACAQESASGVVPPGEKVRAQHRLKELTAQHPDLISQLQGKSTADARAYIASLEETAQ